MDKKRAYLDSCPDCLPLPTSFPNHCALVVLDALKGTSKEDAKCITHCAMTVAAWAGGLWINGDDPMPPPQPKPTQAGNEAAATELEKVINAHNEKKVLTAVAVNWKLLLSTILSLIQQYLNQ